MSSEWVESTWVLYPASVVVLLSTAWVGWWLGSRTRALRGADSASENTALQGALLGLLALMIGFTFSMVLTRHDLRKTAVLDEANAIGTAVLRADFLPEPYDGQVRALLREYVDLRLKALPRADDPAAFQALLDGSERLHAALWQIAVGASRLDPQSLPTSLFVQSLNDVIDMHSKRLAARRNTVPISVFALLYSISGIALGFVGYDAGLSRKRSQVPMVLMALCIVSVILLIVDLDRPYQGLITVSQQDLIDLRSSLGKH